jgi:hypothetical protein
MAFAQKNTPFFWAGSRRRTGPLGRMMRREPNHVSANRVTTVFEKRGRFIFLPYAHGVEAPSSPLSGPSFAIICLHLWLGLNQQLCCSVMAVENVKSFLSSDDGSRVMQPGVIV